MKYLNEHVIDYVYCTHCGDIVDITQSDVYVLLKSLKGMNLKMDFDKLLEVVKSSQIATLETQIIMLKQLEENTNTSYADAIAAINVQINNISNV